MSRNGNEVFSLGNALGSLSDEVKYPIYSAIGLRSLALLAPNSKLFKSAYDMVYSESLDRGNDQSAQEYLAGLQHYAEKIIANETNKIVRAKKLLNIFERLSQAYKMARLPMTKEKIAHFFATTLHGNINLFNDENKIIELCLRGFAYQVETVDVIPHFNLGGHAGRREHIIHPLKSLLRTSSEDNKRKIVTAVLSAINTFLNNPPPSLTRKGEKDDYNTYIQSLQDEWQKKQRKLEPGCVIS